jgi:transposase
MFSLNDSNRFFLYPRPTDMRKSFYSLSGIVTNQMGRDVRDGDAFIFVNKTCTTMKVLHMECEGLVIYYLKLEQGYIHLPSAAKWAGRTEVQTDWSDLVMMVEGITPDTCRRAKRWSPGQ